MTATSAIPAAIDALVALATVALPDVTVLDGPGATDDSVDHLLFVGVDDPDGEGAATAAEAVADWSALGARQRSEDSTIHLVAVSWNGGDSMKVVRGSAFTTVAAIERAIVDDPTLGGVVLYATFGGVSALRQSPNTDGVVAQVHFTVRLRARLT